MTLANKVNSPLKYHGAKSYLAQKIVSLFPPRQSKEHPDGYLHYVEPFAGGLSVLLANDPEGISEAANDIHFLLMNFWCCLANPSGYEMLRRKMEFTPFSQALWEACGEVIDRSTSMGPGAVARMPVEAKADVAAAFFIHCRMSLAGRMESFAPLSKSRTRRGMNEQASAWLSAIEGLPEVHARLKRVVFLSDDALKVIDSEDSPTTLFYMDPPYVKDTRTAPDVYAHEMTNEHHQRLIDLLVQIKGKAVVSMYHHPIYDALHLKHGWHLTEIDIDNKAASGKTKRVMTECLLANYQPEVS